VGTILQSLAPLGALYLLHLILKATGLGNLTKLSGSIGMATQAAVAATGDKGMRNAAGAAFDGAAGKLGGRSSFGNTTKADQRSTLRKEIRKRALSDAVQVGLGSRVAGKGRIESLGAATDAYRDKKAVDAKTNGTERFHRMRTLAAAGSAGRTNRAIGTGASAGATTPRGLVEIGGRRMPELRAPSMKFGADPEKVQAEQTARQLEIEKEMQGLPAGSPRRDALNLEMARLDTNQAIANTWGPEYVGEVIPERARLTAQAQFAELNGLDPSAVIVNSMGLPPQIAPVAGGFVVGLSEGASIAALRSFRNFLPDNQKVRLPVGNRLENDDEYSARLYHTGVAVGAIDPSTGQEVDWLLLNGIDTTTDKGKQAAVDFMEGRSSTLSNVAAIEMSAATNARLNAVRRTLDTTQAVSAQHDIENAFVEQRSMFTQDQQVVSASAAAVLAATTPITSSLSEMTTYASSIYEHPEFAQAAKASANQALLKSEQQLHAMRQQVNDAIDAQVRMQVELEVCDDTANGRVDRLTDEAISARYQELTKNAKDQAQNERNQVEQAFGELQRQFNNANNASGNNRKVDPVEVQRLVKVVQDQVNGQRQRLNDDAAGLASLCNSEMERAEKIKDQRLNAYARSDMSGGASPITAHAMMAGIDRSGY
jgi:hypothetical protein